MILAKKTSKNQITIPKKVVDEIARSDYFQVSVRGGNIVLRPILQETPENPLLQIREKMRRLGLKQKDITTAIRWARQRSRRSAR